MFEVSADGVPNEPKVEGILIFAQPIELFPFPTPVILTVNVVGLPTQTVGETVLTVRVQSSGASLKYT